MALAGEERTNRAQYLYDVGGLLGTGSYQLGKVGVTAAIGGAATDTAALGTEASATRLANIDGAVSAFQQRAVDSSIPIAEAASEGGSCRRTRRSCRPSSAT